jgi:hypothetical protein
MSTDESEAMITSLAATAESGYAPVALAERFRGFHLPRLVRCSRAVGDMVTVDV